MASEYMFFVIVILILINIIKQNNALYSPKNLISIDAVEATAASVAADAVDLKSLVLKTVAPILSDKGFSKLKKRGLPDPAIKAFQSGCDNEDKDLTITELITKTGFPVEMHEVQTSDGYILTVHRIPNDGPPVFLMHGLLCSSDDWTTNGRNSSLSYILADQGFDVWMGNARGNKHSRRHVTLSPVKDKYKFWDFSWDEIGRYDLSAMIDYVLDTTKKQQLVYIGHSQGVTTFYVLCSERPEYNQKISLVVLFSSPVFMADTRSLLLQALALLANDEHSPLVKLLGPEIDVCDFVSAFKSLVCDDATDIVTQLICTSALFLIAGFDYHQAHYERLPTIMNHLGSGSSLNQVVHYAQIIKDDDFKQFDHGVLENTKKYGSLTPPHYPLDKVTAPVVIFYGKKDLVDSFTGIKKLLSHLINSNHTFCEVPSEHFDHTGFLIAKDVKKLLYDDVLKLVRKYS